MDYNFIPEEAVENAEAAAAHLIHAKMKVYFEKSPWASAPYCTSLYGTKGGLYLLVEAQRTFAYTRSLRELASWLSKGRYYAELYIAVGADAVLPVASLTDIANDGIGLFTVDASRILKVHSKARNQALVVTPEPTLKLGRFHDEVQELVYKFNSGSRKDAVRDMCELVERITEELGTKACTKGWIKTPSREFLKKDWESQINELARPEVYNSSHSPLFDTNMKNDLLSFKGARNLMNHKTRSAAQEKAREIQFAERMMQGPRLVADLLRVAARTR